MSEAWRHSVTVPDSVMMEIDADHPDRIQVWSETEGQMDPRVAGAAHLWRFEEGGGAQVADWKGDVHLVIEDTGAVEWIDSGGLRILSPTMLTAALDMMAVSDGLTLEAWLVPAHNQYGRVFSWSQDKGSVNLELRQSIDDWSMRCRGEQDGAPSLMTNAGLAVPQLTHIVWTLDEMRLQDTLYLGGWQAIGGDRALADFGVFPLIVGNTPEGDRPWLGELHLLALYGWPLSEGDVAQNFAAGPHPGKVPAPEPATILEAARGVAWGIMGIPLNPTAALTRYARQRGLGAPLTNEFDFPFDDVLYRGQGFATGIAYCEVDRWDAVWGVLW